MTRNQHEGPTYIAAVRKEPDRALDAINRERRGWPTMGEVVMFFAGVAIGAAAVLWVVSR